ncbi:PucR family transcriptional regulator [soil metagenome]
MATSDVDRPPLDGRPAIAAMPVERSLAMIPVHDLLRHALPDGATVVAGKDGLHRDVTWASRLRPAPPAFEHLSGGELVLLPPNVLEMLDDQLSLEDAIRQLNAFGISAIALAGETAPGARAAANDARLPLIVLPEGSDFGILERVASRYISERRREILRRGQDAGRQLMELAIAGEPLGELARELAALSGRAVAFESREGRLLAFQPGAAVLKGNQVDDLLTETRGPVFDWLRTVAASSSAEPPSATWPLGGEWMRIVAPVSGRDGLLGSVSLFARRGEESVEDGVLASRGAAACAVTLTREQAAANARREIELNVLDEILDGALRSEVSLLQQIKRLGHDLDRSFFTVIARVDPAQGSPARARDGRWAALEGGLHQAARARDARILWRVRNTSAEIVWPVNDEEELDAVISEVQVDLNHALARHGAPEVVSIGVGRIRFGLAGIRQSHQDARQALTIGRRLFGPGKVTRFEKLGVYRLIYAAEKLPELEVFQREALGSLIDYDFAHGAELIKTLEAFFRANCSPKEAASLLHVHRNTVLYRLERIAEITGFDLNSSEVRLRLHLALHVRMALSA